MKNHKYSIRPLVIANGVNALVCAWAAGSSFGGSDFVGNVVFLLFAAVFAIAHVYGVRKFK